jgi:hypothetical protein
MILGQESKPTEFYGGHHFSNLGEQAKYIFSISQEADARWAKARQLGEHAKALVPSDRQQFFQASVLTQVDVQLHSNRMLMCVAEAVTDTTPTAQLADLKAANDENEKVTEALKAADYGKWKGFYTRGDWIVQVPLTISLLKAAEDKVQGKPVPENTIVRAEDGGFAYHMITAYQGTQRVQF